MLAAVFLPVTTELSPTGLLPAMSRDLGVTEGQLGARRCQPAAG
jgi:MFS transporter, DHA1 family, inner membrane transport protein